MTQERLHFADEALEHRHRSDDPLLDLAITILLSIAAVLIAIAVYHNEGADHEASVEFTEAIKSATEATDHLVSSTRGATLDHALFVAYVQDLHAGDHSLADYLQANVMSPELRNAVAWWRARASEEPSPFAEDSRPYGKLTWVREAKNSAASLDRADEAVAAGKGQQRRAADYTRSEVFLTIALVLSGLAGVIRPFWIRVSILGIGVMALFGGGALLIAI